MATHRSYLDACGAAHALDLVGERWALLVVRELVLGGKRYSDLKSDLPGISTNVLAHRLDELEQAGVVRRRRLPPPAGSWVYELTAWGADLEPVLRQLGRWGARSPAHDRSRHLGVTSFVLSLRTNVDPRAAAGPATVVELRLGEDRFLARLADGGLVVDRGSSASADAMLTAGPRELAGVTYGGRSLSDAVAAGDVVVTGDVSAAERFLASFALPEPATA